MPTTISFTPVVGNYVAPANLETVASAYNTLEQGHQQTIAAKTELSAKMAELPLNAAEDGWRREQLNKLESSLRDNTKYGNAYSAYDDVMRTADAILTSDDMRSKLRSQAQYSEFIKSVDDSNLTNDKKTYIKEINPYYDAGINQDWKAAHPWVEEVNLRSLQESAYKMAARKAGGGNTIYYMNRNGQLTQDISQSVDGLPYINKAGKYEQLDEATLREAMQAAIAATPGAQASLDQDYQFAIWDYKRNGNTDVLDNKGMVLNGEQYLEKRLKPFYTSATYMHYYGQTTPLAGMSVQAAKTRAASGSGDVGIADAIRLSRNTTPGNYNVTRESALSSTVGKRKAATESLLGYANRIGINADINNLDNVYNEIKEYYKSKGQIIPEDVYDAYNEYKSANSYYNQLMPEGIGDDVRDKIDFITALENGVDLGTLTGNTYATNYINYINEYFEGKGKGENDIPFYVKENNIEAALKRIDGDIKNSRYDYGISVKTDKYGKRYISLPKEYADKIFYVKNAIGDLYDTLNYKQYNQANFASTSFGVYTYPNPPEVNERLDYYYNIDRIVNDVTRLYNDNKNSIDEVLTEPVAIPTEIVPQIDVIQTMAENAVMNGKASDFNAGMKYAKDFLNNSFDMTQGAQLRDMRISINGMTGEYVDNTAAKQAAIQLARLVKDGKETNGTISFGYDKRSLDSIINIQLTGDDKADPAVQKQLSILKDNGIKINDDDQIIITYAGGYNNQAKNEFMQLPSFRYSNEFYNLNESGVNSFDIPGGNIIRQGQNYYITDADNQTITPIDYNSAESAFIGNKLFEKAKYTYANMVNTYGNNIPQDIINSFGATVLNIIKRTVPGNENATSAAELNTNGKLKYNECIREIMRNDL